MTMIIERKREMVDWNNYKISNNRRHCCSIAAAATIVVVFAAAVAVLRACNPICWFVYFMIDPAEKLKQAKLGQFSIFSIRNRTILCLNQPYNWLVSLYCTNLSSNSLKKECLCLQIALGQTWFELYSTAIFFFCTHSMRTRIERTSPP